MSWRAYLSRNLQSVKLIACPVNVQCANARAWYIESYAEIKHLNPRFPFMIRHNPDGEPYVFIEYGALPLRFSCVFLTCTWCTLLTHSAYISADRDEKVKIDLAGLTKEQIDDKIRDAVIKGEEMPRAHWQSIAPLRLPTVIE